MMVRRYHSDSELNYHHDDIIIEIFPHWFPKRQNIITANIYFNDSTEYEGGDLQFASSNKLIRPSVGDVVLFLIDPSESGGTPLEEQLSLLREVKGLISARRFILVRSKADIDAPALPDSMSVSSIDGTGLEELQSKIVTCIAADVVEDPLNLPSDWHREDTSIEL